MIKQGKSDHEHKKRVLIAVIHGPYEPWLTILKKGQLKTWCSQGNFHSVVHIFGRRLPYFWQRLDIRTYYLRWHKNKFIAFAALILESAVKRILFVSAWKPRILEKEESGLKFWEVQFPDFSVLQGVKNLSVFRKSLEREYDFLVTTITSSYIDVNALLDILDPINLTMEPLQAIGRIETSAGRVYQQGSFRVFSRALVEFIVKNQSEYPSWLVEDIALGRLVEKANPKYKAIQSVTVDSLNDLTKLSNSEMSTTAHFRCKSTVLGVRKDSELMLEIHRRKSTI